VQVPFSRRVMKVLLKRWELKLERYYV
jgi:hypothetical protein